MTAVFLLQICFVSTCSHALFNANKRLGAHKALVARRTSHAHSASWRHHQRRNSAPAAFSPRRRQRAYTTAYCKLPHQRPPIALPQLQRRMTATQEVRRRSSVVDRASAEQIVDTATITSTSLAPMLPPRPRVAQTTEIRDAKKGFIDPDAEAMPPPPPPAPPRTPALPEESGPTRQERSASSTSPSTRNTNRLSLTLPIALPTSEPTRPTPTTSVASSHPSTPADSGLTSPVDANDFIIAIAAQERKVLEIREELAKAETELTKLKKQWSQQEQYKKRHEIRNMEPLRSITPQVDGAGRDDDLVTRRSVEMDRRKALIQSAQNTPNGSPNSARRRVFRGGHTRTLSLMSPVKTDSGFAVHEDGNGLKSPDLESRSAQLFNPALPKRASWQPRTTTQSNGANGVKQIAEDFKVGLWSFVEDIRQATVGEEPITGHPSRVGSTERPSKTRGDREDTIRAPVPSRPRVSTAFETQSPADSPLAQQTSTVLQEQGNAKATNKKTKHFSWTPLSFENFDDGDWSSWDSPSTSAVKSPRWSGSTANGEVSPIPEQGDENDSPLKKKSTSSRGVTTKSPLLSPSKLEELLPTVVNRLSPRNIKRTASDFITQWEKSLAEPQPEAVEMKENANPVV